MGKLLPLVLFLVLTGCNGAIKDFVGGAVPKPPIPLPSEDFQSPASVKLSPGYMKASDNGVSIEANITTTKKVVSGGGISAELTMGRTRSQ